MPLPFFTPERCQRESSAFYAAARREMDRAEISKYNIFAYQKHLHAAATYQAEASNRSARARRLMGME